MSFYKDEDWNMKSRWVKRGLKIAAIAIVAVAVFTFLVMSLWNWLGPSVFGLRTITFWQALGVLILSKILFGGFRGRPGYGGHWRRRMNERWQHMTPEEREKFRQGMMSGCGRMHPGVEASSDTRNV
jgi:chromate transport protein ChrA